MLRKILFQGRKMNLTLVRDNLQLLDDNSDYFNSNEVLNDLEGSRLPSIIVIGALYLIILLILPIVVFASEAVPPKKMQWPFEGAFGVVDRQAAQRGFQVYKEVCSTCHALKHLYYRNLKEIGFSEGEIKEIAKNYQVIDGPNEEGEMFERPAILSDHFVSPYKNDQAARAANNGGLPVDLSLIVKARGDGANYVYSLLTGYEEAPADFKLNPGSYYNKYFPGHQIAMTQPLVVDGQVAYEDGTNATIDQMAHDLVVFLQWAAEPEMEHRKSMGLKVLMFLSVFTMVFYIAKKRVWSNLKK
jgi:ubiquinol-cytochrome c reductase cytochrome c1 subunit